MNPSHRSATAGRLGRGLHLTCASLLAACGSGAVGNAVPADGDASTLEVVSDPLPVSLRIDITPGKPGAPTESVELTRDGDSYRLSVARRHVDGTEQSGTATLTDAEVEDLRNGPLTRILSTFAPATLPDPVDDFGERTVRVQRDASSTPDIWTWDRMLVDDLPATTLFGELAELARDRVPDVLLAYFPR